MTQRRGIVLATVAVVGAAALWIAVALLQVSAAAIATSDLEVQRTNALLRVESAVRVLLGQLNDQRDLIIDGQAPDVADRITLWEAGTRAVVVELLAIDDGPTLRPQGARLDVNVATEEQLAALEGMDDALAADLIAARGASPGGRFIDTAALCAALGVEPEEGIAALLTVYGHAPIHVEGMVVASPFTPDVEADLSGTLDTAGLGTLQQVSDGPPDTWHSRLAQVSSDAPALIGDIIAVASPAADGWSTGMTDINRAPESVLAVLPGMTPERAAHLVAVRDTLDDESLGRLTWPWVEEVLDDQLQLELLDHVSISSWCWQATIQVGEHEIGEPDAPLRDVVRYDVVFDLSEPGGRVAMLRDVQLASRHIGTVPIRQRPEEDEETEIEVVVDESPEAIDDVPPLDDPPLDEAPPLDPDPVPDSTDPAPIDDPRLGRWH